MWAQLRLLPSLRKSIRMLTACGIAAAPSLTLPAKGEGTGSDLLKNSLVKRSYVLFPRCKLFDERGNFGDDAVEETLAFFG